MTVLSTRALNRATLARQLLLDHADLPVLDAVAHLGGLQAQEPQEPFVGLWSRLHAFEPAVLEDLLVRRSVVRTHLMRRTVHLLTAADALAWRPRHEAMLRQRVLGVYRRELAGVDLDELAAAGRAVLADGEPRSMTELARALAERWPAPGPRALGEMLLAVLPMAQLPPRGLWRTSAGVRNALISSWLGREIDPATPNRSAQASSARGSCPQGGSAQAGSAQAGSAQAGSAQGSNTHGSSTQGSNTHGSSRQAGSDPVGEVMVRRYLAAFGPAATADLRAWCGLAGLPAAVTAIRDELVSFRDERGRELLDLPDAPRPDPDTPAPVRFLPAFDNALLGYHDRSRIVDQAHRGLSVAGTRVVLVDGRVAGTWDVKADTVIVTPLGGFSRADRTAVAEQGRALARFLSDDDSDRVQVGASPRR